MLPIHPVDDHQEMANRDKPADAAYVDPGSEKTEFERISFEIVEIRERLAVITDERNKRAGLLDEEHELRARLAFLRERADADPGTPADEMVAITERLQKIERLSGTEDLVDDRRAELVEEERRLGARLQELSDEVHGHDAGLAEVLIKEEGANADEFPALPGQRPDE